MSVPAVGLRAKRHHAAVYVLLANSTGKEISGALNGLPADEPVWSMIIPSIGPESLKKRTLCSDLGARLSSRRLRKNRTQGDRRMRT